jgi:hypothetical protein
MKTFKNLMCVVVFASLGITDVTFAQDKEVSPEQAFELRKAVIGWLECEECEEGQLEAVAKQGELAVPALGAALERGPSPASLERVRMHLEKSHRDLVEYSKTHDEVKVGLKEEEYVKVYLENYRALHASRAAEALGKIGGEAAKRHLENASKLGLRADVQAVVKANVARLAK